MAGSDIKAKTLTASGDVTTGPSRLVAVHYMGHNSTGTVEFKDGGASGVTVFSLQVKSSDSGDLTIPAEGVKFDNGIYVVMTNVTSAAFFFK
jgi:hypothetical protein